MSDFSDLLISLTPSLYWPLDAVNGATDQSGNGRNGTAVGPTLGGETTIVPPILGASASCTDFDGTDDRVDSTYNPFTNATVRTYVGWAYRDASAGLDTIFGSTLGTGTTVAVGLYLNTATQARWEPSLSGAPALLNNWPGNTQWVFWALLFDESADTVQLYANGTSGGSVAQTQAYDAAPGNFRLGVYSASNSQPYDGKQAHVAVFEYGLTAQNIADLYTYAITGAPVIPVIPDIVSAPALA